MSPDGSATSTRHLCHRDRLMRRCMLPGLPGRRWTSARWWRICPGAPARAPRHTRSRNGVLSLQQHSHRHPGAQRSRRVAIVDWDLHHGNGTQAAFTDPTGCSTARSADGDLSGVAGRRSGNRRVSGIPSTRPWNQARPAPTMLWSSSESSSLRSGGLARSHRGLGGTGRGVRRPARLDAPRSR